MRLRASLAAVALATTLFSATALADATPVQLMLTYMPNVSTSGTPAASGIAELVMLEGEVRISAAGLPHLEDSQRYVAWLVNTNTNQSYRVGSFNTDAGSETVKWEDVLPDAIPNKQWNLLLLTIETSAEPAVPSKNHSIAATFPRAEHDPPPAVLPNTGGLSDDGVIAAPNRPEWLLEAGLAALVALVSGAAGYVLGKR